ncbi:hypothetical protein F4824DRAFT_155275 [Ustulina deusta]|nr:hypothetical protein F4824DRAFT_155275 [Ustulina deusta]
MCDIRYTWEISENWFKKGIMTNRMLPESALSKLQQLTGAVLVASSDVQPPFRYSICLPYIFSRHIFRRIATPCLTSIPTYKISPP